MTVQVISLVLPRILFSHNIFTCITQNKEKQQNLQKKGKKYFFSIKFSPFDESAWILSQAERNFFPLKNFQEKIADYKFWVVDLIPWSWSNFLEDEKNEKFDIFKVRSNL
jgi:hypothetical protein